MHKLFLLTGTLLSMLSVMIGAFGAHALKATLEANQRIETFETAVRYQFYHALGLILLGILYAHLPPKVIALAGYSFIVGTLLFSGSLYILSFTGISKWGAVTPLGGLAFIMGWAALAWGIAKGV